MLPSPESFSRSATSEQRTSSEYSWHKDRLTPCVFWTVCSLDSYKPDENQERLNNFAVINIHNRDIQEGLEEDIHN